MNKFLKGLSLWLVIAIVAIWLANVVSAPGREKKDIKMTIEGHIFKIKIKDLEKSFELPYRMESKDLKAKYEAGIIEIIIPKREKDKEQIVEIS